MPWEKIDDNKVQSYWKCEEEDCEDGNPTVEVGPDFYEENGEPTCCDRVMNYQYTEMIGV